MNCSCKISLVIFDMDGVLVDSEDAMSHATAEALSRYGINVSPEEFKPYVGMGDIVYVGEVVRAHGGTYTYDMTELAYQIFIERAKELVHVFPWTKPLLESLHNKNIKIAVASSAGKIKVESNLQCIGIPMGYYSSIVTGENVEKKKPSPDIFMLAAKQCGIDPSYTLVCEDALSGVLAAKAAGMYCAAVTTSFPENELIRAGADTVVHDLGDIIKAYGL